MRIDSLALKYLHENSIDYIVIKSTIDIQFLGCACGGGTEAKIVPVVEEGRGKFKDGSKFILEVIDNINVYIGKSIFNNLDDNSEISVENKFFKKKLVVKNFKSEVLNKI